MVIKSSSKILKDVDLKKLLGGKAVYVGYPESSTRDEGDLTNAQIAYLNTEGTRRNRVSNEIKQGMSEGKSYNDALSAYIRTHGDPRWHIPPRPFVEPGIENALPKINNSLKNAAIKAIENEDNNTELTRVGLTAVNSVRKFIRDYPANGLEPNAESTIKNKGQDHPLIGETGQLIGRITYVIEE